MDAVSRRRFVALAGTAAALSLVSAAPAAADTTPSTDRPCHVPRLIRLWAQAWNTGDAALMASLFTEDGTYTDHAFQATFRGREQVAQWVVITLDSIADARATLVEAFRSGDRAVARWTFTGTFTTVEPFTADADPRGKSFSVPAVSWFTVAGGQISAVEDHYNLADLMRQLGLPVPYQPPQS